MHRYLIFIFFLICLSLCFLFLFGGLGLVVLGIGGNEADFRDIFGDHLWNRVDGWMPGWKHIMQYQSTKRVAKVR
jgi:hypothetical protein